MKSSELNEKELFRLKRSLRIYSYCGFLVSIVIFIMICIFSFSSSASIPSTRFIPFGDKGAHMIAYSVFGLCLYTSFSSIAFSLHRKNHDVVDSNWSILPTVFTLLIGLPIGIVIEFIQDDIGRTFELLDILADGLGLIVGCAVALYFLKLFLSNRLNKIVGK